MTETNNTPEALPVSRLQRALPLLSYSVMALGGAAAALYALRVASGFGDIEHTGLGVIASSLAGGLWAITTGLLMAMLIGGIAIVVQLVTMFTQKQTASPSPLLVSIMAAVAAVPSVVMWPVILNLILAPMDPSTDAKTLASSTWLFGTIALVIGLLVPLAGLLLTALRLSGRPGRRWGTLALMIVVELLMLAGFVYMSMQARSITRMAFGY